MTKPNLKEIRESPIWPKLEKESMRVKRGKEGDKSSRANLEDSRSQTETKKGLTEYAGATRIRHTSTNDIIIKHEGDKGKARHACTDMSIRQRRARKGLVDHKRRTAISLASTNTGRADYVTTRAVKYYRGLLGTSVFKLILRMLEVILMLVSACILIDIRDFIPSIKFLARSGCSLGIKFPIRKCVDGMKGEWECLPGE